jgi:hypothetical protein
MKRFIVAGVAACLAATPALAASPQVEASVRTLKGVASDGGKLKTFCEMSKVMESAGEKEDRALDAKIDGYMKQLGPDFEKAWSAGDDLDENSADGKVYNAAVDDLMSKCP